MASIKNSLFYSFILSLSQLLMPLISIPFISRVLDPAGVGKVAFIDSFTYYFITIAEFGILVYGMRETVKLRNDRKGLRQLVSELVVLHLVSSAFTTIIYAIIVFFIWAKIGDIRLLLFSLSFLLVNAFACEWYFLGTERFKYITIRSLITRTLGLVSIFILIKGPADYYIYYGIMVVAACSNGAWNTFSLLRELPLRLTGLNWKRHIKYTRISYGISLLYSATLMLDNVFLRLTSTVTAVAFYSFAMKIVRISGVLLSDSLLVFFPRIVSLLKDEKTAELQEILLSSVRLIIFLAVPLCMGLFLLSGELIHIYLGESFSEVAVDLKIVAVFPLLKLFSLFISKQVLISHNNEQLYFKSLVAGCVVFCLVMPLLSYHFSHRGACYAIVITESVILGLNYYYAKKIVAALRFFDFKDFMYACLSALLFIPVVYLVKKYITQQAAVLLLSAGLCFILYMVMQLMVFRSNFALYLKTIVLQYISKK